MRSRISVSGHLLITIAALLLLMPPQWFFAWFIAVSVHELFHCLALLLCNGSIEHIVFDINGAKIQSTALTDIQALICIPAGPIGALLLLLFHRTYPQLALCALIQSIYNLLPIYPLDGGRIVFTLANMLLPQNTAKCISDIFSIFTIIIVLFLSLFAAVFFHTYSPLLIPVLLFYQYCQK